MAVTGCEPRCSASRVHIWDHYRLTVSGRTIYLLQNIWLKEDQALVNGGFFLYCHSHNGQLGVRGTKVTLLQVSLVPPNKTLEDWLGGWFWQCLLNTSFEPSSEFYIEEIGQPWGKLIGKHQTYPHSNNLVIPKMPIALAEWHLAMGPEFTCILFSTA